MNVSRRTCELFVNWNFVQTLRQCVSWLQLGKSDFYFILIFFFQNGSLYLRNESIMAEDYICDWDVFSTFRFVQRVWQVAENCSVQYNYLLLLKKIVITG